MKSYLELVKKILSEGEWKENRTGIPTLTISGAMVEYDLSQGFPAVTTKKLAFKTLLVELEGFIKGVDKKQWYQERGCHIWDEWANPAKIKIEANAPEELRRQKQLEENDLGPIYGVQWRNFGACSGHREGVDQLKNVVAQLKKDPNNRRMLVSAWNPLELDYMALPPCHFAFHLVCIGKKLNLTWFQRSCDLMLGIPFNIASYGTLLHLLCLESGLEEGKLVGMLSDVHIYKNHLEGAKEQVKREPYPLPKIETQDFTSLFEWEHRQTKLVDYQHHPRIQMEVAV